MRFKWLMKVQDFQCLQEEERFSGPWEWRPQACPSATEIQSLLSRTNSNFSQTFTALFLKQRTGVHKPLNLLKWESCIFLLNLHSKMCLPVISMTAAGGCCKKLVNCEEEVSQVKYLSEETSFSCRHEGSPASKVWFKPLSWCLLISDFSPFLRGVGS